MKKLYLVWDETHTECVGFTDRQDAEYARKGNWTNSGVSTVAESFREIMDLEEGVELLMTVVEIE